MSYLDRARRYNQHEDGVCALSAHNSLEFLKRLRCFRDPRISSVKSSFCKFVIQPADICATGEFQVHLVRGRRVVGDFVVDFRLTRFLSHDQRLSLRTYSQRMHVCSLGMRRQAYRTARRFAVMDMVYELASAPTRPFASHSCTAVYPKTSLGKYIRSLKSNLLLDNFKVSSEPSRCCLSPDLSFSTCSLWAADRPDSMLRLGAHACA